MKKITIIEHLKTQIPHGTWCNNGAKENWCPYFEIHKPKPESQEICFCTLHEEYVRTKICDLNMEVMDEGN